MFTNLFSGPKRAFDSLNEQEILGLAISAEEDDARIYLAYADKLREAYPQSAKVFEDMAEGLQGVDVVMMLRLQRERMDGGFVPSEREYYHRYGLDAEKLAFAKPDAIVMHPGPMNRGVEIDGTLADDINRSVIQDQVERGVAVRMAAMDLLARNLPDARAARAAEAGVMA